LKRFIYLYFTGSLQKHRGLLYRCWFWELCVK